MSETTVCPWWLGSTLNNKARRVLHNPEKIFNKFVKPGMTVMDVGCGMGFLTIPLAKMVMPGGRVIAVDLQEKMLQGMRGYAQKEAVLEQIIPHKCNKDSLDLNNYRSSVDFAVLFMMLHEVPDAKKTIAEVAEAIVPGGAVLFAEPIFHVPGKIFEHSLDIFKKAGFQVQAQPSIRICRSALLVKSGINC